MPCVCFNCRKSFKRPREFGNEGRRAECPACHGSSIALHPHFKAPRSSNLKQWKKVQFLVENGFYFSPLVDQGNGNAVVSYPKTLQEAPIWVKKWAHLSEKRR
jgi:hypothetical protein